MCIRDSLITDIDPIEFDLLFERFLNPERVSLPDFDIDFCIDGRDRVIQHVSELYGRDAVSQIITFGTMAAKAVVRDVARVQGKPYGLADRLSKMIPFEPGMTLKKAMQDEPVLVDFVTNNDEAEEIMEMAFRLEGLTRNIGKHAGGVVIAPTCLTDFTPVYCDATGNNMMTQFDMLDVEQVGLRDAIGADQERDARADAEDERRHVLADSEHLRRRVVLVAPPHVLGLCKAPLSKNHSIIL